MSTRMIRIYASTADLPVGREGWIANVAGVFYINNGSTWEPMEAEDEGTVATARLNMATNPTANDTVTIGADVYQFKSAAGAVTNDTYKGVVRGADAAASRANLIAAINGEAGVTGLKMIDTTTAALSEGTENLVADQVGTTVRIRTADDVGGTPVGADPSIVLGEALTHAADIWDVGNVNLNTLAGRAAVTRKRALSNQVAITAAMLPAAGFGSIKIDFPFTPTDFRVNARKSTGVPAYANGAVTDAYTIVSEGILCTFGAAGGGNLVATDLLQIEAWE